MFKHLKRAMSLGVRALRMAPPQFKKQVKMISRATGVTPSAAKRLAREVLAEAKRENNRVMSFAMAEARRELRRGKALVRRARSRPRKSSRRRRRR